MTRHKLILATFVFLALISSGAGILVHLYFAEHSPTEPRPLEGKTHLVISNKVNVYLTSTELVAYYLPGIGFYVWFGGTFLFRSALEIDKSGFKVARI